MIASPFRAGTAPQPAATPGLRWRPATGSRGLGAWILRPAVVAPGARPLVALHGIGRDAAGQARQLAARAASQGRVVVAPLFPVAHFPRYQRARCPAGADRALLALLDALVMEGEIAPGPVDLAGYSGGAQFAHRFAWLHPHRAGRLTLTAAGWWLFPDAAPYPYGLGVPERDRDRAAARWSAANLPAFLDRDIAVAVGAADNVPDANTRRGPAIDAQQGLDRLSRARRWVAAVNAAASTRGLPPPARLTVLSGAGHDFGQCIAAGLDRVIFPDFQTAAA
jgi:pimeloyl-ACP methyl ester carboxylesterase